MQDSSAAEPYREESPLGGVSWHEPHQTWQRRGEAAARPWRREAGGKEAKGQGWAGDGEERLAVRKLKAKDGLGVKCKRRGLGHRQVP